MSAITEAEVLRQDHQRSGSSRQEVELGYETSRPTMSSPLPPVSLHFLKALLPPKAALSAEDQVFRHGSLWRTFRFKPHHPLDSGISPCPPHVGPHSLQSQSGRARHDLGIMKAGACAILSVFCKKNNRITYTKQIQDEERGIRKWKV